MQSHKTFISNMNTSTKNMPDGVNDGYDTCFRSPYGGCRADVHQHLALVRFLYGIRIPLK